MAERMHPTCPTHGFPARLGPHGWVHRETLGLCIGPDPERDKRVAARRAGDAAKARSALDRLISNGMEEVERVAKAAVAKLSDDIRKQLERYAASELQQKSHYGIPPQSCYGGEHGSDGSDEDLSGVRED